MGTRAPARTRENLIQAAGDLLERDGLDAVTLRAVGSAAGVSRTAPYRHFADKEQLLASVAADGMRALRQAMVDASRSDVVREHPAARVESALNAYADAALARPAHYRLIFGAEVSRRDHPELMAEGSAAFELLAELVARALDAGPPTTDSPVAISAMLWSAAHGVVDLTLSGHATSRKGLADPHAVIRLAVSQAWPRSPRG